MQRWKPLFAGSFRLILTIQNKELNSLNHRAAETSGCRNIRSLLIILILFGDAKSNETKINTKGCSQGSLLCLIPFSFQVSPEQGFKNLSERYKVFLVRFYPIHRVGAFFFDALLYHQMRAQTQRLQFLGQATVIDVAFAESF